MRHSLSLVLLPFAVFVFQDSTRAQDVLVPAGTLLHCTLDEPNLSSATASVGDPVICHLRSLQEFGHVVLPRGSYLGGHIESYKEPGHFFGKGNLKLTFDRLGLPSSDVPVPSKLTAVSGQKVNRKGEIVGHGHAKRDTVEWLLPPLWPWKVITLPARGPRPALKGEQQMTLRLMEDVVVPRAMAAASLDSSGNSSLDRPRASSRPASFQPPPSSPAGYTGIRRIYYAPPSIPAMEDEKNVQASDRVQTEATRLNPENETSQVRLSVIALKSGEIYSVAHYRIDNGSLNYELPSGEKGSIDLPEVDWRETSQLNSAVSSLAPIVQRR
jgi:hypothetical protein